MNPEAKFKECTTRCGRVLLMKDELLAAEYNSGVMTLKWEEKRTFTSFCILKMVPERSKWSVIFNQIVQ